MQVLKKKSLTPKQTYFIEVNRKAEIFYQTEELLDFGFDFLYMGNENQN